MTAKLNLTVCELNQNKTDLDIDSGSRDSSVGIATGYGLDERGVGVRVQIGS
jgi:hypothetical protein